MIRLIAGFLMIALEVVIWIAAGASPSFDINLARGVSDFGVPLSLLMLVIFYGPFLIGAYYLWRGFKEHRKARN